MAEAIKVELTPPQKAAAVIVSLGADKASGLYQFMEPEEIEALTLEVARLGMLDSEQTEAVLTEFYQNCMTSKAVTEGGLEYARSVLEKAFGNQTAMALLEKTVPGIAQRIRQDGGGIITLLQAISYQRDQYRELSPEWLNRELNRIPKQP